MVKASTSPQSCLEFENTSHVWNKTEICLPLKAKNDFSMSPRLEVAVLMMWNYVSWKSVVSQWPRSAWRLAPETTTVFTVTLQSRSGHVSQCVIELWSTEMFLLHVRSNGCSEAVRGDMTRSKIIYNHPPPSMFILCSAVTHLVR